MPYGQTEMSDSAMNRVVIENVLSVAVAPLGTYFGVNDRDDAGCSESRWITQRLDPPLHLVPPPSLSVDIAPRVIAVAENTFCRIALPVPDGPGRQALLQRFTL